MMITFIFELFLVLMIFTSYLLTGLKATVYSTILRDRVRCVGPGRDGPCFEYGRSETLRDHEIPGHGRAPMVSWVGIIMTPSIVLPLCIM